MSPRIWRVDTSRPDPVMIEQAAAMLRRGGLVAFPTETVYGLGADATNAAAMERLNRVKGRPPEKPYSLHVASVQQVVSYVPSLPARAVRLMARYWPGPLTLILTMPDGATVGFRLPDHPVALAWLTACRVAVAGPSANLAGMPPPRDARAVLAALGGVIDGIVDAGPTTLGQESSVVRVTDDEVIIVREGALSKTAILAALDAPARDV